MEIQGDNGVLWNEVVAQSHGGRFSIHGPQHWERVCRYGLLIAEDSGADVQVVQLFALFHDSRRESDGHDPGHGFRGAQYAQQMWQAGRFELTQLQFDQLFDACRWHTDQQFHDDVTIATCWDADRLDLGRVAIRPDPQYLNTEFAKQAARLGPSQLLQ